MGKRKGENQVWSLEKKTKGCWKETKKEHLEFLSRECGKAITETDRISHKCIELDNKGNNTLLTSLGVILIIAGIIVAYFTVTGPTNLYSMVVIAILLIASGFYIVRKSGEK